MALLLVRTRLLTARVAEEPRKPLPQQRAQGWYARRRDGQADLDCAVAWPLCVGEVVARGPEEVGEGDDPKYSDYRDATTQEEGVRFRELSSGDRWVGYPY